MTDLASNSPQVLTVLLDTIADRNPGPKAPKWEAEAAGGFMAAKWHTCTACRGDGTVKRRNHRATCTICHGAGQWRVDAYDDQNRPVEPNSRGASEVTLSEFYDIATDVARDKDERALQVFERHIERNIDRLLGLDVDLEHQARSQHPCWAQLEQAMQQLRADSPPDYAAIQATHFWGLPLHPSFEAIYPDALVALAARLPLGFRAPQWAITRADETQRARKANGPGRHVLSPWQRAQRDKRIRDLAARGDGPTAIGKAVGLDRGTVAKILAKTEREAA